MPLKHRVVDANAVIDLCDGSDDEDYDGATLIRAINGAILKRTPDSTPNAAFRREATTTMTVGRHLKLASNSSEEVDEESLNSLSDVIKRRNDAPRNDLLLFLIRIVLQWLRNR